MAGTPEMDKAETLAWLRRISGDLATATIQRLEDTLPWYADMPPARRSAVGLVAQAGISSFIQWYDDPTSTPWIAADIFAAAPRELLRSVSLQQTLQLIRVTVTVTEERVAGRGDDLREGILLYSRDVAFAAADVYARAAEARGLWDARLEALVVDSILTGEADEELPSRIAALGWHGHGEVSVLVGTTPPQFDVDQLRRTARKLGVDVLIGVQGSRLVLVIGRADTSTRDDIDVELPFLEIARRLEPGFGAGHLVLGPSVPALVDASQSARAALAGFAVARAWRHAPRPVEADDLLPERALAGDPLAKSHARRAHLPAPAGAQHGPRHDAVELSRQRPLARGDGARAVRASQHRPLPTQARVGGHRMGCHGASRGADPADRTHPRLRRTRRHAAPTARATREPIATGTCAARTRPRRILVTSPPEGCTA